MYLLGMKNIKFELDMDAVCTIRTSVNMGIGNPVPVLVKPVFRKQILSVYLQFVCFSISSDFNSFDPVPTQTLLTL